MLTKSKVLELLSKLPERFSLDELIAQIKLSENPDRQVESPKRKPPLSNEDFEKEIDSWFK